MPALSPTMKDGKIVMWAKKEGEYVKPGEKIAEVETDKATVDFDSVEEGYLAKILVPAGTEGVPLGRLVAILVENEADVAKFKDFQSPSEATAAPTAPPAAPAAPAPAAPAPAAAPAPTPAAPAAPAKAAGERLFASPLARRLADERGVQLSDVSGTGPGHRIIAADVNEYQPAAPVEAPKAAAMAAMPPAAGEYQDVPLTKMRQVIAERLSQSKREIPHYYLSVDVKMDNLTKLRTQLNSILAKSHTAKDTPAPKLSVNDFIVKASALALRKVPAANSSWMGNFIREYKYVDVCVAVATEAGLITPIVKDADLKGLATINSDVRDLAARARIGRLQPQEYQGGTFTISNLGMFGVKNFSAIINPPQACILAVGSTETRVVVNEDAKPGASPYSTANFMSVTLSCDHRVVDGAVGAQWLQAFKQYLEEPASMML